MLASELVGVSTLEVGPPSVRNLSAEKNPSGKGNTGSSKATNARQDHQPVYHLQNAGTNAALLEKYCQPQHVRTDMIIGGMQVIGAEQPALEISQSKCAT